MVKCNQCDSAYINGIFYHETGCPNKDKVFSDGDWVETEDNDLDIDDNGIIDRFDDSDYSYTD